MVIKSYPSDTSSVNNEMLFVMSDAKASDPVTYPNYRYVADVYVDAVLVARLKVVPDPIYYFGVFNVSDILRSYVGYGFNAGSNVVDYTVRRDYQVKFGEEVDDTLTTNILEDSTRYAFETYKPRPFTSSSVVANGLASNMPATIRYHEDEVWELIPYFSNVSGISNLSIAWKDAAGNTLGTDTVSNAAYAANTIRQANIGTGAFTKPSGTKYALITGAGVTLRVNFMCDSKYPAYTLAWLNPFGGYDSQSFGLVSKKSIEIERKEFGKLNYQIDASGVVSYQANNVYYGSKRAYASTVKMRLKLTSHLLNENEYTWLADLFISPDVYIYDGSKFIPVTITRNDYDYNNYKNSKLTALEFTIEFTDITNSQLL